MKKDVKRNEGEMRINWDDRERQDDANNLFFKASETMESNSFHFCKCVCVFLYSAAKTVGCVM